MITGLPSDFVAAMNSTTRRPVQLIHFILPGETFYLSDRNIGVIDGLDHDYQPWVESWNTMRDNSSLNAVFEGSSLEIKAGTITILASPISKQFILRLIMEGAENVVVELYQWFEGMTSAPVLDDIMVCQDPINYSEASMLVNVDLVSVLMIANKHLWPQSPGHADYPVIIGKALGVPLIDLQTERWTELVQDLTYTDTGDFFIENGVGFAASGVVTIDSEAISYSAITASVITITARAQNGTTARPHYRGARICPYGGVYDYAVCAGPVSLVDNLKGSGLTYANNVSFFPGQNPVIARFVGRPPWLKIEAGADGDPIVPNPVTLVQYAANTESHYGNTAGAPYLPASINAESGAATLNIDSTVNGGAGSFFRYAVYHDLNNLGVNNYQKIGGSVIGNGCTVWSKCGSFGNVIDGAIGSIDSRYGFDDTAYGNIVSVSVAVSFGVASDIIQSSSKLRVILVAAGGGLTTLQEWVDDGLSRVFGDTYRPAWYNTTKNYTISVATFADLANTEIRVELENVHSRTATEYSTVQNRTTVDVTEIKWTVNYFIPAGTVPQPYQELAAHFNRDLSGLGTLISVTAKVRSSFSLINTTADLKIVRRSTNNPTGDTSLWSALSTTTSIPLGTSTFNLGSMTWAALQALRIGCYHKIIGPTTEGSVRKSTISFNYVQWEITYQPGDIATPDEQRVVYADDLICDVTSELGADPTPPEVLQYLIETNSPCGQYIDTANFAAAHTEYDTQGFYLNGKMSPGTRFHDALKLVLSNGMCRFLFSQGKIKLITAFATFDTGVDMVVSNDNVQLRSRGVEFPPTAQLLNQVTVSYNLDLTTDLYSDEYTAANSESIAKYYLKDFRKDLSLVSDTTSAEYWADRYLGLADTPSPIYYLTMYMPAYVLEKGDRITINAFFDSSSTVAGQIAKVTGQVLSIERIYGQGKNGQINLFRVKIFNVTVEYNNSFTYTLPFSLA